MNLNSTHTSAPPLAARARARRVIAPDPACAWTRSKTIASGPSSTRQTGTAGIIIWSSSAAPRRSWRELYPRASGKLAPWLWQAERRATASLRPSTLSRRSWMRPCSSCRLVPTSRSKNFLRTDDFLYWCSELLRLSLKVHHLTEQVRSHKQSPNHRLVPSLRARTVGLMAPRRAISTWQSWVTGQPANLQRRRPCYWRPEQWICASWTACSSTGRSTRGPQCRSRGLEVHSRCHWVRLSTKQGRNVKAGPQ